MNQEILKNYAKLIVKVGANVQEGQDVIINANVQDSYFVKYLVLEAYKALAREVRVEWNFDEVTKLNYEYQSLESLTTFPKWKLEKLSYQVETLPAVIYIDSKIGRAHV